MQVFCAKLQILEGGGCAGARSRADSFPAGSGGLGDLSICALKSHCRFSVNFAEKSSAKSAQFFLSGMSRLRVIFLGRA
jgi:hypothetical protein